MSSPHRRSRSKISLEAEIASTSQYEGDHDRSNHQPVIRGRYHGYTFVQEILAEVEVPNHIVEWFGAVAPQKVHRGSGRSAMSDWVDSETAEPVNGHFRLALFNCSNVQLFKVSLGPTLSASTGHRTTHRTVASSSIGTVQPY